LTAYITAVTLKLRLISVIFFNLHHDGGIMRHLFFLLFLFLMPFLIQITETVEEFAKPSQNHLNVIPVGIILPKHATPEVFIEVPNPVTIRIINRGKHPIYVQGSRRSESKAVHFFFYHREKSQAERGRGWKPFFESLPCNHPVCRNLHVLRGPCKKSEPYVIRLGPAGSPEAVKDFVWEGLLYQKVQATMKNRERRFCYKGWVPQSGRIRIEVEYSDRVQHDRDGYWQIGGRDHTAIEFDLPAVKKIYVISVGK